MTVIVHDSRHCDTIDSKVYCDRIWYGNPAGPTECRKYVIHKSGEFALMSTGKVLSAKQAHEFSAAENTEEFLLSEEFPFVEGQDLMVFTNSGNLLCFHKDSECERSWYNTMTDFYSVGSYGDLIYHFAVNMSEPIHMAVQRVHNLWDSSAPIDELSIVEGKVVSRVIQLSP